LIAQLLQVGRVLAEVPLFLRRLVGHPGRAGADFDRPQARRGCSFGT